MRAAWIVLGLAAGFLVAGLATEPFEAGKNGPDDEPWFGHDTRVVLKAVTTAAATTALLMGAVAAHRRGHAGGTYFLASLGASVPAWYGFYEVDHVEGMAGVAVTCALAWVGLSMHRPLRTSLLAAQAVPWIVVGTGAMWDALATDPTTDGLVMTWLVVLSTVACTLTAWGGARVPTHARARVALAALGALALVFLVAGVLDVLGTGGRERWPVVATAGLALAAMPLLRSRAQATGTAA